MTVKPEAPEGDVECSLIKVEELASYTVGRSTSRQNLISKVGVNQK